MQVEHIFEKGAGAINEDAFFVNGTLFGVFDGATSLNTATYENGRTGGYLASRIAEKTFSKNNASLSALASKANSSIRSEMIKRGVNPTIKKELWSTSAAVVRIADEHFEWVQTGDCLILAIFNDGTHRVITDIVDHDLETLQQWKSISEKSDGTIMTALKSQILNVREKMNIEYGVLNGEQEAIDFIKTGCVPLEGLKHLVLFSDGLFIPQNNPEKRSDFSFFVELFCRGGLKAIRDHVRMLEEEDSLCKTYPRFKKHDDIAAVALSFV